VRGFFRDDSAPCAIVDAFMPGGSTMRTIAGPRWYSNAGGARMERGLTVGFRVLDRRVDNHRLKRQIIPASSKKQSCSCVVVAMLR
jgi:hypothetical protein